MTTRFTDHLLTGTHAARPAANAVPTGTLYSCTTHGLIYKTDGSTWSTWATLGSTNPGVKVTRSADPSIADTTMTVITWDTESWDDATMHDNATNPSRLIAPNTGKYLVTGQLMFSMVSGTGIASVCKNAAGASSDANTYAYSVAASTGSGCTPTFAVEVDLTAGDYVEIFAWQNSGSAKNIDHRGFLTWAEMRQVA